jgi:hypothetical protein
MNNNNEKTTRTANNKNDTNNINTTDYNNNIPSLIVLCRTVVTNNIERYAPESFQICDIYEWQEIIKLRYQMTQPKKQQHSMTHNNNQGTNTATGSTNSNNNSNDLDGNGRLLPAISDKVLQSIEVCNEHLAECVVADTLVWKDCVEYRFKRNVGLHIRPPILFLPWPILLQELHHHAQTIASVLDDNTDHNCNSQPSMEDVNIAIHVLHSTTWNISLLRDTGVGKVVKKVVKKINTNSNNNHTLLNETMKCMLQQLLSDWMELVSSNDMNRTVTLPNRKYNNDMNADDDCNNNKKTINANSTVSKNKNHDSHIVDANDDLQLLESCLSWRQLFHLLEQRKMIIQTTQGKRMREIRHHVCVLYRLLFIYFLNVSFYLQVIISPFLLLFFVVWICCYYIISWKRIVQSW